MMMPEKDVESGLESGRWDTAALRALRPRLQRRAVIRQAARMFFGERGFLEVDTPVRIMAPALEDYIDAEPSGSCWLRTSPELHMKRLLAAGYERIFQLGPCFRMGEDGRRHLPEFQMLEWYRLNAGWRQVLDDTVAMLRFCAQAALGSCQCRFRGQLIDVGLEWEEMTVEEAFRQYAGADLDAAVHDGCFEQILVERVEPHLGQGRPTVLSEYPLACSGLSQPLPGRPDRVERWEVYVAGLELGNACSELVDVAEQRRRFAATAALRAAENRAVYPVDEAFMTALDDGIPAAAGVAIGFDRLVMVLTGADDIHEVTFS
jgi:lysyl-tRNA synthetase class 2